MLKLDDTGQKTYSPNPFSMYSFSLMPGNRQQRQLEDWRDGSSASTAAPNQIPEFVESPVYNLQHCELLKAKPLLQAEALWPELADQWCGVYAEAQAAEKIGLVAAKRLTALANGKCTSIGSIIKNKRPPYSDFYDKVLKLWDADKFIARAKVDGVWNDGPAELGKAWPGAAVHRVR